MLPVVCRVLSGVWYLMFGGRCSSVVAGCLVPVVWYFIFVVCCLLCGVGCMLIGV